MLRGTPIRSSQGERTLARHSVRRGVLGALGLALLFAIDIHAAAHANLGGRQGPSAQSQKAPTRNPVNDDYVGMYTFVHDSEFVQITKGDEGTISGFVARYGELESDKGVRLDHFFKSAHIDGDRLTFTTERVHGISYTFDGTFSRGAGKKPGEEGYIGIEGKLIETMSDEKDVVTSREREITLKSLARKVEPSANRAK